MAAVQQALFFSPFQDPVSDMHTLATTDLAVNGQLGQGDRTNRAKSTLIEGDLAGQAVVIRDSNFTNAAVTECNER